MSELTVGREMDAAVAVAVGYVPQYRDGRLYQWTTPKGFTIQPEELPYMSTSDADAFAALDAVLEKRKAQGRITKASVESWADGWQVRIGVPFMYGIEGFGHIAATRAEAICKAILALAERDEVLQ